MIINSTMNATAYTLESLSGTPALGWLITIMIFFSILGVIFILSKNFRQFIYGAIFNGILFIIYKFSRWVGVSSVENNFDPLKWTIYIIIFIIGSIIVGRFIQRLKFVKDLEKEMKET